MSTMQGNFNEINTHLMEDSQPSLYFNEISEKPLYKEYPFMMLDKLKYTEQSLKHHPEGNVWNHTMLVLDEAAKVRTESRNERVFMWAALLHDIGKPETTRNHKGKITAYDHDKAGAVLSRKFLAELTDEDTFIEQVAELIRWHMQILYVVNGLPYADVKLMKKKTDIYEVALLGLCDRLGRLNVNRSKEVDSVKVFLKKCGADKSVQELFTETKFP